MTLDSYLFIRQMYALEVGGIEWPAYSKVSGSMHATKYEADTGYHGVVNAHMPIIQGYLHQHMEHLMNDGQPLPDMLYVDYSKGQDYWNTRFKR